MESPCGFDVTLGSFGLGLRLGILEAQQASLSNRIDRLDDRVARIERRLELSDA